MLSRLSISNYALIEDLEVEFSDGFITITGETGAGKSIILGALSLILGQRADLQVLFNKSRKCIVEGVFNIKEYKLNDFFAANALDYHDITMLRREITPDARSRSFINDTPVNLNLLRELGEKLVDIHSQHQNLLMATGNFQLAVIDSFAGITQDVEIYSKLFREYTALREETEQLKVQQGRLKSEHDYHQFLFQELENASSDFNNACDLEQQAMLLNNAEQIKEALSYADELVSSSESNLLSQLLSIHSRLNAVSSFSSNIEEASGRVNAIIIELKDIAYSLNKINDGIHFDEERLQKINEKLDVLNRLMLKHRVNNAQDLEEIMQQLEQKITHADDLELQIAKNEKKIEDQHGLLKNKAEALSAARSGVFKEISERVGAMLKNLGMPEARIAFEHQLLSVLSATGIDQIAFTFSANKGMPPMNIAKVASGGELSRLMLVIKTLISQKRLLPTIIFDEIDSGVSGEVAAMTAQIMKQLAGKMQVMAITHLPQIAAKGSVQYQVLKKNNGNVTQTFIEKLTEENRIVVIAEMLGGKNVNTITRNAARQLLELKPE